LKKSIENRVAFIELTRTFFGLIPKILDCSKPLNEKNEAFSLYWRSLWYFFQMQRLMRKTLWVKLAFS